MPLIDRLPCCDVAGCCCMNITAYNALVMRVRADKEPRPEQWEANEKHSVLKTLQTHAPMQH
jgi:hypothetical protein